MVSSELGRLTITIYWNKQPIKVEEALLTEKQCHKVVDKILTIIRAYSLAE